MSITINEFIDLTKKEPLKWINYCEIIILKNGKIELARPSHTEKLIEIYCKAENITREVFNQEFPKYLDVNHFIIEKYSLIAVWYRGIIRPEKINRFQKRTLKILIENKLITPNQYSKVAKEYSWYLNNKKL